MGGGSYSCACDANAMVDICTQLGALEDSQELREFVGMAAKLTKDAKVQMKPDQFKKASDGLKRVMECPELDRLRANLSARAATPWASANRASASAKSVDLL